MKKMFFVSMLSLLLSACTFSISTPETSSSNENNVVSNSFSSSFGKFESEFDASDMNNVIYHSFVYHQEVQTKQKDKKMPRKKHNDDILVYDFGDGPYTYRETYFFSFDYDYENTYLASKIGIGHIEVVVTHIDEAFGEDMIVFRNEDTNLYFSCLLNGGGGSRTEFISGKTIQGHAVVKDYSDGQYFYKIHRDYRWQEGDTNSTYKSFPVTDIKIENEVTIEINEGSFTYIEESFMVSLEELAEFFKGRMPVHHESSIEDTSESNSQSEEQSNESSSESIEESISSSSDNESNENSVEESIEESSDTSKEE